jgi:hypothetical protein
MSDLFERMVDRVLKYKPPPKGKKAEREATAKKKKPGKKKSISSKVNAA